MKALALAALIVATFACWTSQSESKTSFVLRSKAFVDGGTIPHDYSYNAYGCTGKNISPELHWSGAPAGVKSFALTVFDPDANKGKGWWHWVVYGIDPHARSLAVGEPFPGLEGKTDFGSTGYGGPGPAPRGPPRRQRL